MGKPGRREVARVKASVSTQYPITFRRIYRGAIVGDRRIITMNPGVYGWPGGTALHRVRRFDSRGAPAPHGA
ncbi:MAG: hypothetical protein GX595_19575, partial [Lentisphaerae bacterium]|nr:hypothetical protein [Lentisphaerota bacterium]